MNTVFIITIEDLHGFQGLRNRLSATHQNAINVKGIDKVVGDLRVERRADGRSEGSN